MYKNTLTGIQDHFPITSKIFDFPDLNNGFFKTKHKPTTF